MIEWGGETILNDSIILFIIMKKQKSKWLKSTASLKIENWFLKIFNESNSINKLIKLHPSLVCFFLFNQKWKCVRHYCTILIQNVNEKHF